MFRHCALSSYALPCALLTGAPEETGREQQERPGGRDPRGRGDWEVNSGSFNEESGRILHEWLAPFRHASRYVQASRKLSSKVEALKP